MKRPFKPFKRARERNGVVLIVVLVCTSVAVSLVLLSVQIGLRQRRHLRKEHQLEQTRWVLDAAIRKSIANPSDEPSENEIQPKLEKFDKVLFEVTPNKSKNRVLVRAKIEDANGTNVMVRSASFEITE